MDGKVGSQIRVFFHVSSCANGELGVSSESVEVEPLRDERYRIQGVLIFSEGVNGSCDAAMPSIPFVAHRWYHPVMFGVFHQTSARSRTC
jgi:hypothetical protein